METSLTVNDPVKSLVENNPRCAEVFEELNIDFYCGGDTSLLSACEEKDLEPHRVYLHLMELHQRLQLAKKMFSGLTPAELADHIESTHHVYLKKALPRLAALMDKVHQAHSPRHAE